MGTALFYPFFIESFSISFLMHYRNYKTIKNDKLSKKICVGTTRTIRKLAQKSIGPNKTFHLAIEQIEQI
jgi:hypothetical protein